MVKANKTLNDLNYLPFYELREMLHALEDDYSEHANELYEEIVNEIDMRVIAKQLRI